MFTEQSLFQFTNYKMKLKRAKLVRNTGSLLLYVNSGIEIKKNYIYKACFIWVRHWHIHYVFFFFFFFFWLGDEIIYSVKITQPHIDLDMVQLSVKTSIFASLTAPGEIDLYFIEQCNLQIMNNLLQKLHCKL